MPTLRAAALAALLALFALPSAAHAGDVAYGGAGSRLTFTALPGEANQLSITRAGDRIVFSELGGLAIGEAEAGCDGDGTATVSCLVAPGLPEVVSTVGAELGDLDDRLTVGALGPDMFAPLQGEAGADRLDASAFDGFAFVSGGAGDDRLVGGRDENALSGGSDGDTLVGGPAGSRTTYDMGGAADGKDLVQGGAGLDVVEYEGRAAALRLTADGVPDDGEPGEGDDIWPAVEGIQGGDGADVIAGSAAVDGQLSGYGGADRISGGGGDDVLFGGAGDDALAGAGGDDTAAGGDLGGGLAIGGGATDAGADSFAGGAGLDTADYSTRSAAVTVTLDGLPGDGEAGEGDNVAADVERILGGRGADALSGNDGAQRITGGSGGDTIDGGAGVDEVRAGDGDDVVKARDGAGEAIDCGLGADTLTGDFDDVPDGCETVSLSPPPSPADTRAPKVRIRGLPARPRFRHVKRGLRPRLIADEPVSYVVELLSRATRAHIAVRKPYNLTLVRRTIALTSAPRRITLRPPAALLGRRHKLRVRIRVTATDAAGNVTVARRTIKARR